MPHAPLALPATRPMQLVTLAASGDRPVAISVGNVSSEPAPAMVLAVPATRPTPASSAASATCTTRSRRCGARARRAPGANTRVSTSTSSGSTRSTKCPPHGGDVTGRGRLEGRSALRREGDHRAARVVAAPRAPHQAALLHAPQLVRQAAALPADPAGEVAGAQQVAVGLRQRDEQRVVGGRQPLVVELALERAVEGGPGLLHGAPHDGLALVEPPGSVHGMQPTGG